MRTLPLAMAIANRAITVWPRQVHMPPQQATYLRKSQAACVRKMSNFPVAGYAGPSCPTSNCGICYQVTNQGGFDGGSIGGVRTECHCPDCRQLPLAKCVELFQDQCARGAEMREQLIERPGH